MPYVTSIERRGRAEGSVEGRIQTLRETIVDSLEARFGDLPYPLRENIQAMHGAERLKKLHRQAVLAASLEAFTRAARFRHS